MHFGIQRFETLYTGLDLFWRFTAKSGILPSLRIIACRGGCRADLISCLGRGTRSLPAAQTFCGYAELYSVSTRQTICIRVHAPFPCLSNGGSIAMRA